MGNNERNAEVYADLEDLLKESLSDIKMTDEKEEQVLEYLCKTISETDSQGELKKRVEQGDTNAQLQLASWYIANAKNIKDYCEAYKYASKAAKNDYIEAYYILGQLHLYGVGCAKNVHKAIRYLRYFVQHIKEKELLNEEVLVDAYVKLAETEKALGHFSKAYLYYRELRKYDSHYEIYAKEMIHEMEKRKNELLFHAIFFACGFLVLGGLFYFLIQFFDKETKALEDKYPQKVAVTVVEDEESEMEKVTEQGIAESKVLVEEPVLYRLVTETEFLALAFSEIPVQETATTSEYISQKGNYYGSSNLIDHDSTTTWQEGEDDAGIHQTLTFSFKEPVIISAIRLENGKRTSKEEFYENNRMASFSVYEENPMLIELPDAQEVQYIVFENPVMESQIALTLESVFSGTKWNDTCITEIAFYE